MFLFGACFKAVKFFIKDCSNAKIFYTEDPSITSFNFSYHEGSGTGAYTSVNDRYFFERSEIIDEELHFYLCPFEYL